MVSDTLTQVSALCVGATALALGDPTAGLVTATAAGGSPALALGRRVELSNECDRVFLRIQDEHRRGWERLPLSVADKEALAVVDSLIRAEGPNCLLDKAALAAAAFADGRFPEHATELMLRRLGITIDPEREDQRRPDQMHPAIAQDYARGLIRAGLNAAMEQEAFYKSFRWQLSLEEARRIGLIRDGVVRKEVADGFAAVSAGLADLAGRVKVGSLTELLAVARLFGFDEPNLDLTRLRSFLTAKAGVYKRLEAQIEAFGATDGRVGNLLASARAALDAGGFDEARARIADARAMQRVERTLSALRREAKLYEIEAESYLLQGEIDLAAEALAAGAGLFSGIDRREEAITCNAAAKRLYEHTLRFGGSGFLRAMELYRRNAAIWTRAAHPVNWALMQNNLGATLEAQAARAEGAEGAGLLAEAVVAYRAALEVYTRAARPVKWATTQSNLGNALRAWAARTEGAAGAGLLAETVAAYRAALEVYTRAAHPLDWAMTQSNLGNALRARAARTEGAAGAGLLAETVATYRAALEVYTRAAHPVVWAVMQNNLGATLGARAARTEGAAGAELLAEAVVAYRVALEVRTRASHPVNWAMTQNNLGNALYDQAARTEGAAGAGLLGEAVVAYRAALEVHTRAAHPVDWAMTQENLGLAFEALGDREDERRAEAYAEANACFDAALTVYDQFHMAYDHETATEARAQMAGKLANLD